MLLLGAILLASLLFAGWVIRVKQQALTLRLDRPFPFSTSAGQFSIKVSSKWNRIDGLSRGMIAGWEIPGPKGTDAATFVIEVFGFHPTNRNEFFGIISHYNIPPNPSLQIDPTTKGLLDLPNVDLQLLFRNRQAAWVLATRLIYLPNGTTLAMTFIGPQAGREITLGWFEQSLHTLEFKPAQPVRTPPPMDGPTIQTIRPHEHRIMETTYDLSFLNGYALWINPNA